MAVKDIALKIEKWATRERHNDFLDGYFGAIYSCAGMCLPLESKASCDMITKGRKYNPDGVSFGKLVGSLVGALSTFPVVITAGIKTGNYTAYSYIDKHYYPKKIDRETPSAKVSNISTA